VQNQSSEEVPSLTTATHHLQHHNQTKHAMCCKLPQVVETHRPLTQTSVSVLETFGAPLVAASCVVHWINSTITKGWFPRWLFPFKG